MILIYAGDHRQGEILARQVLRLPPEAYRIIGRPEQLRGLRGLSMFRWGNWYERNDRHEVMSLAKLSDIRVYDITD